MYERFTDRARKVMQLANQEAQWLNQEYIGTEHILLGLIDEGSGVAANVLKNLDADLRKIRREVEKLVQPPLSEVSIPRLTAVNPEKLPQTPKAKEVIDYSIEEARKLNHNYVGTEHLLLGLLREDEGVAAQVLMNLGLRLETVREEVLNLLGHNMETDEGSDASLLQRTKPLPKAGKSKTPALDSYGEDVTELARQAKLSLPIGRTSEIEKVMVVLCGKIQPCVLLVGERGSGKRAIVEGVAAGIASGAKPYGFPVQRLVALDLGSLLLGTDSWRKAGELLRASLNEAQRSQTIIRLDTLGLLFADWATGLAGLFKAVMRQTPPPLIAPITLAEYREYVTPNADLASLFQPIFVDPLTPEKTLEVLRSKSGEFKSHHSVLIPEEILPVVVEQADRCLPGCLPGKALRLLDRAAALVRIRAPRAHLPDFTHIDEKMEQLNLQKEAAVAEQDFDKAAGLRDQADKLKKQREQTMREWEQRSQHNIPVVEARAVAEAVALLGHDCAEPRPNVLA